jgi:putative ATPase
MQARISHEAPLAARMRPKNLSEYIGQTQIIGEGKLLRRAIQTDRLFSSIIFWGPPGTGKTTLAQIIANTTQSHFETMSAVMAGLPELRIIIKDAKERRRLYQKRTILFIDEVHRWNKAQQDALLPHVENGILTIIGATTENPYFEVIKALVSRSRVFQLIPLSLEEIDQIINFALIDKERGYGAFT